MKKKILVPILTGLTALSMSLTVYAATPQEVISKNPTSYTAGTNSIYGPKLTQDQLNAVAQSVADFKTNYITDGMSNDQKIKAGNDYVKSHVSYIDWDKGVGANTAYALVAGQGACSGMTRGFIALMDSVDVKAYLVHASGNSHQWILAEFDDGFAFIDIDANQSAGMDIIYHSKTHPYAYDTAAYPAVGSHSAEYGTAQTQSQTVIEGWKQDGNGWWYQNADGSYPVNQWKEIDGKQYYFGGDGYMLTNTTTPDGYNVGSDGAWIQESEQTATPQPTDGVHIYRTTQDEAKLNFWFDEEGLPLYNDETINGIFCDVIDRNVKTFRIKSSGSNVNPSNHSVLVMGVKATNNPNMPYTIIGEPKIYPLEYDKAYSFNFADENLSQEALAQYCISNNIEGMKKSL